MKKCLIITVLIVFLISIIVGFYIPKQKSIYHTDDEFVYSDTIKFHEKSLPEECLPISIPPQDSDIINFMSKKDKSSYEELMIRFLYVANSDEGVIYSLIASNKFHISCAESYIYASLTRNDVLSGFIKDIARKHLMRGVKMKDP